MEKELLVKWNIRESERDEILSLLPELVEKTRNEEGNILYNIYRSENNPNELILHERYADEEALNAHKLSEHYQNIVFKKIIPHLETRELTIVKQIY
ncbi:antibiotic biosynthesis monooxygenase [Flavobacterium salilacus subsp. salilacus]|uniref:putative quinol monooxygenase n=1 Tax=Flavobacterium TaxID=237 RepID=UPI001074C15C|nr:MULTISPECIES: putative quinol monooxygenase [Flavobacterium]KAF2520135.1 antibiotic biosynthesis monooxygenase [Flavobacterium salilacus subsp. salilacus]MBE1613948.1 antibiotic biosynthesis monooxygenase [Flavobacterium sp. SaA2.13]